MGQEPANHAAAWLIANWVYAYVGLNTRFVRMAYGIGNNVAPREDLAKYGDAAVQSGKISREALERLKRREAAHMNSVEGFPLFVAGGS